MIASQGPTEENQNDFWKMIISENVTKIVSLCEKMGDDYISYDDVEEDWKLKFFGDFAAKPDEKEASQYFPRNTDNAVIFD